jgi:hypothetical protein
MTASRGMLGTVVDDAAAASGGWLRGSGRGRALLSLIMHWLL